MISFGG